MSSITSLGLANPSNKFSQSTIAKFMIRAMGLDEQQATRLRALYRASGIDYRYSVLEDYGKVDGFSFYSDIDGHEPFPSTHSRLELFRKHALQLSKQSALTCLANCGDLDVASITHLVVVSCTGMYAPGLDIDLVYELKLRSDIQRTCINFMGCYAAFNAIRLADSFCRNSPDAKVLVVCTELCSIHFQKEHTEDNMLANALFADGSASLMVEGKSRKGLNLRPEAFYCDVFKDGASDMAWTVGNAGFEMRLSAYVPNIIRGGIAELVSRLLKSTSAQLADIKYFAIHPGGKKILEVVEQELGLTRDDNRAAYNVLRNYGNMSSPTVLFVLSEICSRLNGVDDGQRILSVAFGPGLTIESMILEVENV
jgi:prepilin-type processing-associated H-X9-DG protein